MAGLSVFLFSNKLIGCIIKDMKRLILIIFIVFLSLSSVSALPTADVNSENLVTILKEAGYKASIDQDGDVELLDQYDMRYWICSIPEEHRLYMQSGWNAAANISSEKAYALVNEGNRTQYLIRSWYEPLMRTFYSDYDFIYSENEFDEDLFLQMVEDFLYQADIYTDYLIGEGAL